MLPVTRSRPGPRGASASASKDGSSPLAPRPAGPSFGGSGGTTRPGFTAPSTTSHPSSGNSSTVKRHNHPSGRRGDAQGTSHQRPAVRWYMLGLIGHRLTPVRRELRCASEDPDNLGTGDRTVGQAWLLPTHGRAGRHEARPRIHDFTVVSEQLRANLECRNRMVVGRSPLHRSPTVRNAPARDWRVTHHGSADRPLERAGDRRPRCARNSSSRIGGSTVDEPLPDRALPGCQPR